MQHWMSELPGHKPEYLFVMSTMSSLGPLRCASPTWCLNMSMHSRKYRLLRFSSSDRTCNIEYLKDQDIARLSLCRHKSLWKCRLHFGHWLCMSHTGIVLRRCQYTAVLRMRAKSWSETYCLVLLSRSGVLTVERFTSALHSLYVARRSGHSTKRSP